MTELRPATSVEGLRIGRPLAARSRAFGVWYVMEHHLRSTKAWIAGVFVNALLEPVLVLYAIGIGIGTLVTDSAGPTAIDGVGYLQFVAPALLCSALLQISAGEAWFSIQGGFTWNAIFYAMRAAPLSSQQIISGTVLMNALRLTWTGVLFCLVAAAFGAIPIATLLPMVGISVLGALAFGLPITAYSVRTEQDRSQQNVIMRLLVTPMTLLSGTMYPLDVLPIWLQWVGWISPLWHATELGRVVSYGHQEPIWLSVLHVLVLLVPIVIGWMLAVRFGKRRLEK